MMEYWLLVDSSKDGISRYHKGIRIPGNDVNNIKHMYCLYLSQAPVKEVWLHIGFHTIRPWRPTFLRMVRIDVPDDQDDVVHLRAETEQSYNGFRTAWEALEELDMDASWMAYDYVLLESDKPLDIVRGGRIRVRRPAVEPHVYPIWLGWAAEREAREREQEASRKRRQPGGSSTH